jgi:hypothetical protein
MNLPEARRSLTHLLHGSAVAPWRAQRQWIGALLLLVTAMGMTAALYLDITSQAAITGRRIQLMRAEITANELMNADLESQLAQMTSTASMEARARLLGYEPVDPVDLQYIPVPGYTRPEPALLGGANSLRPSPSTLAPEYTESLFDWLGRRLEASLEQGTRIP